MAGKVVKTKKAGRPLGSIKDDTKNAVVRFRTHLSRKGRWVKKAQSEGKKLTEWIEKTLDAAS